MSFPTSFYPFTGNTACIPIFYVPTNNMFSREQDYQLHALKLTDPEETKNIRQTKTVKKRRQK